MLPAVTSAAVIGLAAVTGLSAASDASSLPPMACAHRGASGVAPENTLAAFRRALEIGPDAVELDVHCTKDGVPVCIHDSSVDRTTDGRGAVADLTLAELQAFDAGAWKGAEFAGERISTLRDALELMRGKVTVFIEIKAPGIAQAVTDVIRSAEAEDSVVVISFMPEAIADTHRLAPELPTGLLMGAFDATAAPRETAVSAVQAARRCGASMLSVAHVGVTAQFVAEVHRRGMALWVWTVDDPARMRALAEAGADGITSNFPDRLLEVLGQSTQGDS